MLAAIAVRANDLSVFITFNLSLAHLNSALSQTGHLYVQRETS